MSKRMKSWILFFLPFLILINGCDKDKTAEITGPPVNLRLGIQPDASEMTGLVLLAENRGLFEKNGLQITYRNHSSGGQVLSALEKKEVDLAFSGEYIFLKNILKGSDFRIIASIATSDQIRVVAHKGTGITAPSDLKGRKIAIISESACEFDVGVFLLYHGMKVAAVNILKLPTAKAVYDAFTTNTVDAAILWEPYVMTIKNNFGNQVHDWSSQSGKMFFWLVSAHEQFICQHSDRVHRFLRALREAESFMETHPEVAGQAIQEHSGHSQDHFDYIFSIIHCELILDHSLLIALEDQTRWLISNRLTDHDKMPNLVEYFYFDGMQQVKPSGIHIVH